MLLIRFLRRLSDMLGRIEKLVLMVLMAGVAIFVLMNVTFRLFNITLAWADEMAILTMTLGGFIGASLMLRARTDPAVLILHDSGPKALVRVLRIIISALASAFGMVLFWLCWRWFDLPGLIAAGFDIPAYEVATFNFLYTEQTPVLALPYYWFFLVMPWFALTLTVHALTNLVEDLGLIDPPPPQEPTQSEV
ncbi:MAG TPA: TRAP transporter small permease [Paracoccus sp.]|nr:TRAP transporter small permease [Paracoccus sp. (in: a-proteobacteria)]